jgi:hypothetical protein
MGGPELSKTLRDVTIRAPKGLKADIILRRALYYFDT